MLIIFTYVILKLIGFLAKENVKGEKKMSNIENNKLQLLEHQEEAYNEAIKLFEEKGKAAVIFPTGCGKSFVTLKYILEHPDDRILFLSPRNAIKDQMYEYVIRFIGGDSRTIEEMQKEYGMENNASAALRMAAKEYIPNIECMLYQTISGYGEKDSVNEILEQLKPDIIIVDEMHHLKTKSIKEAGRSNVVLEDESDEIVEEDEDINYTPDLEEREQQNKWGEKFHKFLEDNPQAKLLGLSATPLRTDGANVVERIFEDSVASEITLLEAIEQGIIYPPKYVVPDFIREDELETLLQKIEQAEGVDKEELKEKYDDLVKKSADATGIPELMQEHIEEKDGKYIIYCKDINDMQEKMEKAKEWFGKVDEEPEVYGIHSKDKTSTKKLEQFKTSNSEHIKLMYCVGMIDEGMHLSDISGVILSSKTGSRPTYLQRIGRGISSGKDKKQALVIDLVNNNEILYDSKVQHGYEVNDLELLQELVEWVENDDGELPEFDKEKTTKERTMAKRLSRINNKYLKYVDDKELLDSLDEYKRKQIEDIIELGSTIGMFENIIELDLSEEERKIDSFIDTFLKNIEIKGIRKEFKDILTQQIGMSVYLKNVLEIENWCKENFQGKEIWERRLPGQTAKDEDEKKLGRALSTIRQQVLKQYKEKELEEIEDKEHRRIVEIVRKLDEEYGCNQYFKNILEIESWCKENYGDKEILDRKLPSAKAKDENEKRLSTALIEIRRHILKQYEGKELEEIENIEHRRIAEIVRKLDEEYGLSGSLKNALEIENWCKENFQGKEIWERRLPGQTAKDEDEKKLGRALSTIRQQVLKQYKEKELEEIEDKEHRRIVEIVRRLDEEYGLNQYLKNALEIENWCKVSFANSEIWDRRLPNKKAKDKNEKRLGDALGTIRQSIFKQYEGKELEEIEDKEHRRIVEMIRRLDKEYGLSPNFKNVLEIENWCKENFKEKEIWDRRLPSPTAKDEKEKKLGSTLGWIRGRILKQYEEKSLEQIDNEEDRKIVEIVRRLEEEYNPKVIKQKELAQAKKERDSAKQKNKEAIELEQQVEEQLNERGKNHEEQ